MSEPFSHNITAILRYLKGRKRNIKASPHTAFLVADRNKGSEKGKRQDVNQDVTDKNCLRATKEGTSRKKEEVLVRNLQRDLDRGLLEVSSLYTSLNLMLEHCNIDNEKSQQPPYLDHLS